MLLLFRTQVFYAKITKSQIRAMTQESNVSAFVGQTRMLPAVDSLGEVFTRLSKVAIKDDNAV